MFDMNEKIAVIDIGSNTIRLVIFAIDDMYNYIPIQNIKTPARLSQDLLDNDGRVQLNQTGIDKVLTIMESFKMIIDKSGVSQTIAIATAAMRQATNRQEIIDQVQARTGIRIQLFSEYDEASHGQYAVTHSMTIDDAITVDIGGGSTEVTQFKDKEMVNYHSFPFGAVTLKEIFFKNKAHNDPAAIADLRDFLKQHFKSLDWLKKAKLPIIAIGGSARNVALVHQYANNYPIAGIHGYRLDEDQLNETLNIFTSTAYDKMQDIDGLSQDRKDLIIPANLVFIELYRAVKAKGFYLSTQGLREGVILKYINQTYNMPLDTQLIKVRSIRSVARDFPVNRNRAQLHANFIINLYRQLCDLGLFKYSYAEQEELEFAGYLYLFGEAIEREAASQHTFYLLSNINLLGFSHQDRIRLALLASYKNKTLFQQYLEDFEGWYSPEKVNELERLGGVLKFTNALNDSQTDAIKHLDLKRLEDGTYELDIYHEGPVVAEKYRVSQQAKHLERALDQELSIKFIEQR